MTGCPILSKCDLGLDGSLFIDHGLAAVGGLDTSVNNQVVLQDLNKTTIASNSSKFPCALVLYNLPNKQLNF